ncbi:MAG: hypothetical protein OMM_04031 [Candidatus Magnetoglobus multicellularis str. Araruama]|uniref:Damage-control phosphatase ARMT1-like metal-binding domain-containing protein n=1 Tax=Candidatus Magnetoglobus multicellularis str. Araruama TaxID=890399 RepID=A0A1V1P384_9BACT|nr:MAG: hypothetical protein OMM_04031 [Candidatus Magnetoglobus multicellularis str. Araruama]
MITYLECMPCFLQQALKCCALLKLPPETTKQVVDQVAIRIPHLSIEKSPPWNSRLIYDDIQTITGVKDPFLAIKKQSNLQALKLYDMAKKQIYESPDPIQMAIRIAAAGNVIDYGTYRTIPEITTAFKDSLNHSFSVFQYTLFAQQLKGAKKILYLADNAGEIVFDRLLIETIQKPVVLAVRGLPIINDALRQDAIDVGIDRIVTLIDNGTGYPGTVLEECSEPFRNAFESADLIISKGQGNFETLCNVDAPICMIFMMKCPQVVQHVQSMFAPDPPARQGQFVLACKGVL